MIRIDEIYENTFLPWVRKNLPSTGITYHDPFGRSDLASLCNQEYKSIDKEKNFIYFFDQEPLILDLHLPTFDEVDKRYEFRKNKIFYKKPGVLVVSETKSDNVDYICKQRNLQPFYYFFHGWAALDWYRGYDRTFLITPWTERKIQKTFFSANRIIGGLRQHRVLMLYHFARLGLMHNWISASTVCPSENMPIEEIAKNYQDQYPDIVDVVGKIDLPRLFPGEDTPRMSSCWLDNFGPCAESLVYHVTETVYTGCRLQLTEKSFKPIALGMPFILSATTGSLAYLRSYGFRTFGEFWDETYDLELDDKQRFIKIMAVIESIAEWTEEQRIEFTVKVKDIVDYNVNHLNTMQDVEIENLVEKYGT
jgi:hypothetical protein